ncbi:MAG TPA: sigma factor-like helix-turn-helix DNA-binding protein [Kofleriaceae bacterium]|nr:sigma factor-like helix-turn-helix DNA-binding protein [Kofleriaceae bacterium]
MDAVVALYERARMTWPEIARVTPARFATELARRLGASLDAAVAGLHDDIYLVIGASDGDPAAAETCDKLASRAVDFAASRLGATATQSDDVRSEMRRLLFTSDGGRPAALATFTGRGDLRGYLRVMAARELARRMRLDRRETELDSSVLELFDPALDPEVAMLRDRYRDAVEAAFTAALAELSPRARAVLRYHLVDGWTVDQLGARYATHRSTASRWLVAAREELRTGIRSRLAAQLIISESQVDAIVALVTSRIEVSLDRLLA